MNRHVISGVYINGVKSERGFLDVREGDVIVHGDPEFGEGDRFLGRPMLITRMSHGQRRRPAPHAPKFSVRSVGMRLLNFLLGPA